MKCALVTGASSGIGEACARELAIAGVDLILMARREARLKKLAQELSAAGVSVRTVAGDVRDSKCLDKVDLTRVDVLINNAGLARGTEKVQSADIADWDEMIDTNVKGLLYITRAVLPHMIKNGVGHVVNIGSVAGRWVYPGGAVYCASKFAVRALSEGLRMDLIGTPVRVTNIEPGMVRTEFSEVRLQDKEKAAQVYEGLKPLSAQDIAEAVMWSLDRPAHVNVQELVLFPVDQPAVGQVHRQPNT
jgi:hypothetical protein